MFVGVDAGEAGPGDEELGDDLEDDGFVLLSAPDFVRDNCGRASVNGREEGHEWWLDAGVSKSGRVCTASVRGATRSWTNARVDRKCNEHKARVASQMCIAAREIFARPYLGRVHYARRFQPTSTSLNAALVLASLHYTQND